MPLFKYRAVDEAGQAVEGSCEDSSAHSVAVTLMEQGLQVSSVQKVEAGPGLPQLTSHIGWSDLEFLTSQLHGIAKSGLPLAESLQALAHDLNRKKLKNLLTDVRDLLERGYTLAEAVESNATRFPPIFVTMIRAGEQSGNLVGVLALLASYSKRQTEVRDRLQVALAYPVLVLLMTAGVLGFLLTRVVPIFAEIFSDLGAGLPAPTQFLVDMSDLIGRGYPAIALMLLIGSIVLKLMYRAMQRTEEGRYVLHSIILCLPMFGRFFKTVSLGRFTRTLGLLLASRVPVMESLELAAAASGNGVLRRAVLRATTHVSKGEGMAESLSQTGFFGRTFCWMLSTGEQRGDAHEAMLNLADSYDRQMTSLDKMLTSLIGPALLFAVAFVIGYVVIALYMPIFSLGDAIS